MSEWQANLNISDYRASKIIWNDTKPEPISWDMNIDNLIFNVCVGVWVGGFCVEVVKWKIFDEILWFEIIISNEVSDSS